MSIKHKKAKLNMQNCGKNLASEGKLMVKTKKYMQVKKQIIQIINSPFLLFIYLTPKQLYNLNIILVYANFYIKLYKSKIFYYCIFL